MSHFTVLVVGANPEEQLAPFQENNCDTCPEEYMTFYDQEDEFGNEYNTGSRGMIVMEDGKLVSPYDDCWEVPGARHQYGRSEAPAELERREVPFKELYATLEEFAKEWRCAERDEERNRFGYMENPQAKWDWYELGGRWIGFFKMKTGTHGAIGRPGLMTESPKVGYADAAIKGDVDFDGMSDERALEYGARWDKINAIIAPFAGTFQRWEAIQALCATEGHGGDARDLYHAQPMMQALRDADEMVWQGPEEFFVGREQYVQNARDTVVSTFAVIKDGKWYERGEMGWWGCVHNEKDENEWTAQFTALVTGLPEDTLLSVYDCHI